MDELTLDFRAWMDGRGLSAKDISEDIGVSSGTLENWRSQGIPARRHDYIRLFMQEWEDRRVKALRDEGSFTIKIDRSTFNFWNQCALDEGQIIEDWAIGIIEKAARKEEKPLRVAEPSKGYLTKPKRQHVIRCPYAVAAGSGQDGDDLGEVPCYGDYPEDHFAVKVFGDSMDDGSEDAIPDGCLAIFRPIPEGQPYAKKGVIYAWHTPDGPIIKRYNTKKNPGEKTVKLLESLNPEFADIPVTSEMKAIGFFVCVDRPDNDPGPEDPDPLITRRVATKP